MDEPIPKTPLKLAVVADFVEERWPSMDLFADELLRCAGTRTGLEVARLQPKLLSPLSGFFGGTRSPRIENLERASGRYLEYPLRLLLERGDFDRFHFVDHSYAHLILLVPEGRAGVYCHDIDAFRPALEGRPRERWRRALARVLIAGLRRASVVFYSTEGVRSELEAHGLVEAARLVQAPPGVAPEFRPERDAEDLRLRDAAPYVLHVGSLIPRKHPEFLLRLAAETLHAHAGLELVQVGGDWSDKMLDLARSLGISERLRRLRALPRPELAALYRNARAVVLPSLAEGFGLPVIEALSCGAPVVASDLTVLRQVGGDAVTYAAVGDLDAWSRALHAVLANEGGPSLETRLAVASRYSWQAHTDTIVRAHARLAGKALD